MVYINALFLFHVSHPGNICAVEKLGELKVHNMRTWLFLETRNIYSTIMEASCLLNF